MKRILVTGSSGFVGKNLVTALRTRKDVEIETFDLNDDRATLRSYLSKCELIFHLAGVNRPSEIGEFETGNVNLTKDMVDQLLGLKASPAIIFSSTVQAELANPYGISKKKGEDVLKSYSQQSLAPVVIFRLPNIYGKWCRPNYNSVVATFCYQIAHDSPITISDPEKELELVYIDDVVSQCISLVRERLPQETQYRTISPTYRTTLGKLAEIIRGIRSLRKSRGVGKMDNRFYRTLYATFVSYLDENDFAYDLEEKRDTKGVLAELYGSNSFGQVFFSRTKPGILRGNHYHHTKVEKFCVLEGEGIIRLRQIFGTKIHEYPVSGRHPRIVDIPPGYTHSIENVGTTEMITIFWSSELFDPQALDTNFENVI